MGGAGARSTWRVDIVDLRRHLGDRREVTVTGTTDELRIGDSVVAAGTPICFAGELESIPAGVACSGTLSSTWAGSCRRCLAEVGGEIDVEVAEVFARDHVDGDTYPLGHDDIDLEPLVRDALLLALPTVPLCREDCEGPEPGEFPVVLDAGSVASDGAEAGPEPRIDPRWAGLEAARAALEEPGPGGR